MPSSRSILVPYLNTWEPLPAHRQRSIGLADGGCAWIMVPSAALAETRSTRRTHCWISGAVCWLPRRSGRPASTHLLHTRLCVRLHHIGRVLARAGASLAATRLFYTYYNHRYDTLCGHTHRIPPVQVCFYSSARQGRTLRQFWTACSS